MNALFRLLDALVKTIIKPLIAIIGFLLAFLIVAGVVSRSLLSQPLFGVEEIVLISVMWFYMLGAVLASKDRTHLTADFLPMMTDSVLALKISKLAASLLSLLIAGVFVVWSFDLATWSIERQQTTPVFGLPWALSQCSPFVCASLMAIYAVRDVVADLISLQNLSEQEVT
ncbi:MAG: TRAP transporter small permease subunit [Pseudomonadota bacterium]